MLTREEWQEENCETKNARILSNMQWNLCGKINVQFQNKAYWIHTQIVNWFEVYVINSNGEVLVAHAGAKNIFVVVIAPSILTSFYLSIASVYRLDDSLSWTNFARKLYLRERRYLQQRTRVLLSVSLQRIFETVLSRCA